jgi:hypothetical protein
MAKVPDDRELLRVPIQHLHTLPAGTELHRVHRDAYKPSHGRVRFNASDKGRARFSPLRVGSVIVPTIYAALSLECALMESIFHDVSPRMGVTMNASKLQGLVATMMVTTRDLRLIDLTSVGLRRFGLQHSDLIDTLPDQYPITQEWAAALYEANSHAQGLYWTSRLDNRTQALMLFGDQPAVKTAVRPTGRTCKLQRPSGGPILEVLQLAEKIGVDIYG